MDTIKLRGVVAEDFVNYKKPSMFLITSFCNFKCCIEAGIPNSVCQNEPMVRDTKIVDIHIDKLIDFYIKNDITKAVVFGGFEPMLQFEEVWNFINKFRKVSQDDVVIYTGYNKDEIVSEINKLKEFGNIIVKFGRFVPDQESHFDDVLGVELCSPNQYGEKI